MTHREATIIAMRELGLGEERLQKSVAAGDRMFIEQWGEAKFKIEMLADLKLPAGTTERDYIEEQKHSIRLALIIGSRDKKILSELLEKSKAACKKKQAEN